MYDIVLFARYNIVWLTPLGVGLATDCPHPLFSACPSELLHSMTQGSHGWACSSLIKGERALWETAPLCEVRRRGGQLVFFRLGEGEPRAREVAQVMWDVECNLGNSHEGGVEGDSLPVTHWAVGFLSLTRLIVYLFVSLRVSVCVSVFVSLHVSVCLSVYLCVCVSLRVSVCVYICGCVYL